MDNYSNNANFQQEDNIDIMAILRKLWSKRIFIIKVTACFFVLGVFVALFSPKEYSSSCTFVPQSGGNKSVSRYASLASMVGIDLDMTSNDAQISPKVYPKILGNADFLHELMHTPIHFIGYDEPVDLYDYYTDKKYAKFNFISTVKKYTIGLPGLLIGAILPKPSDSLMVVKDENGVIRRFTKKESKVCKIIIDHISMDVNPKEGFVTISARMPEAIASAELCETVLFLLKKYVINSKVQKAQANLNYIEEQCEIARLDYEQKQNRYARFMDANRGVVTNVANVERTRIAAEMELSRSLYNELAKNVLTAKIRVNEETVAFTELSPVTIPNEKSKPQRLKIIFIWTFLGIMAGCAYVYGIDWLKEQKRLFLEGDNAKEDQHQQ